MATLLDTTINDTGSLYLPRGTTAQRPSSPVDGDMRYNTDLGYIEFYFKGFWINAETNIGGVPMEGLRLLVDVGNPNSWDGSTLTDVSGNNVTVTRNGGTEQTSSTGSKYFTGGTGNNIGFAINASAEPFTVMTLCGYNGGNRERITSTNSGNNWLLGHWSNGDVRYYAEGWIIQSSSSGNGASNNQWGVHVGTGRTNFEGGLGVDEWQYWKNGTMRQQSTGGSNGPTSLGINTHPEKSDWKWQFIAVWDRVLIEEEIRSLSTALLARGGF